MKKILLMNTNFGVGGISSSMINTANELTRFFDVSIFCMNPIGVLKDKLSEKVTIIDSNWKLKALISNVKQAKTLGTKYLFYKVFSRLWSALINNRLPVYFAIKSQEHLGHFDLACSYTHEQEKHLEYTGLIRVLISKVDAPVKLSWIHCDYNYVKRSKFNSKYYNKMNAMVGVSKSVANAFRNTHPDVVVPLDTCPNMLDYCTLFKLASEQPSIEFNSSVINCFSACRLSRVKGILRAIQCFGDIMKSKQVFWYIAGNGTEKDNIMKAIQDNGLEEHVILLGETMNPYNYMKQADLYINVSYQEAAPLVFMEAKALHVPIFSTNTLSAHELLDENIDYICENNSTEIRRLFEVATLDKQELVRRKHLLDNYQGNNDRAIEKFHEWIRQG